MDENGSIESLTLEINARSESAEKAVDKLISTLERLQTKTANLGLGNIGTQLNGIRRAAAGFGDKEAAGLDRILSALDRLQNVSTIKISSSIANQLGGIATAAGNINGTDFSGIERLSRALSGLAGVGQVNISSALNQLNRIPKIAESLNSANIGDFAAKIMEITDALRPLADEMEKVSKGFSAFPDKLQKVLRETEKIPSANQKAANSYALLMVKASAAVMALRKVYGTILSWVEKSNDYIESQNLFNVAMGQYAGEARKYAETVSDAMGIDSAEWMKHQGVLMTLGTGFGIAGDKAAEMSKNMTQLAYDLSSFYNIKTEEAFQKLESGFAGEIEPLRRLGYDLSNAALQQIAYSKGINKTVSSMSQAEKASLRYYAMMTQVTQVQGDMARTINQPANQLRVLKARVKEASRALGNLFLPVVQKVVPWLIAGAEAVTRFAEGLALIFGIKNTDETGNLIESIVGGSENIESALGGAADQAKKLKKTLLGIDELNVLSEKDTGAVNLGGGLGALDGLFDEDEIPGYDFMAQLQEQADALIAGLDTDGLRDKILTFANLVSNLAALTGKFRIGGIGKLVTGIGEIYDSFKDFQTNGLNLDNVMDFIGGLSNIAAAIGLFVGKFKFAGALTAVHGFTQIIPELVENWEAIKQNDWSGVDKVKLAIGVIEALGGVVVALGVFSKLKSVLVKDDPIKETAAGMGKTFNALKKLSGNLAMGLVVLVEVAAAAALIVGSIFALGYALQKIADAWTPVIENSETVTTAMVVGTGLLAGIGTASYALGTIGKTVAMNMAIGMAVMLEIGVATALFVAEIWLMGEGLTRVASAWTPVIENGETVKTAILTGTALLLGIGIAAAAIGAVSVASAGTLPAAIAIGTIVLAELAVAFIVFTDSVSSVADSLSGRLAPSLSGVNQILPGLTTDMSNFVDFMAGFAGQVVRYTTTTAISGLATTIDKIIGWFAGNPIDNLATEVEAVGNQARRLSDKLIMVNPELETAILMLTSFHALVETLNNLLGVDITLSDGMFVNMQEVGMNLISGLAQGMMTMQPVLMATLLAIAEGINTGFILYVQGMFLVFFENLNASFTMNAELINALYTNSAATVSTIFIAALTTQFATFFATQTMQFSTLRATITTTFQQSYVSAVSGFITPTRAQAMNMVAQLKSQFAMLRAAIVSDFNQAAAGARNAFASLASWFRSAVYAPIVSMLSSLNSQINSTISRANSAAASVASLGRVRYYASGGFVPNHGQVFVAREQGPELVGRIGNQSAVANNNQIIAGIKQGVYEAMMASNSGGRSGDINLYVSGKQIMTAVAEEARRETVRTGVNPLTQGG